MPAFWALPSLLLTDTAAAGSIGLINSVGNLGGFVGPFLLGFVESRTDSFLPGLLYLCYLDDRLRHDHPYPRSWPPRSCAKPQH